MIVGVGIDVVDVQRLVAALHRSPRLRERLFVPDERSMPETSLAARFATKEALAKALGAPMGLHWHDAVVRRVAGTQPVIEVKGTVAARAAELGITRFHVSISHDAGIAAAVVVAERD